MFTKYLHLTLGRPLTADDVVCVAGPFTLVDDEDRIGNPADDFQDYSLQDYLATFEPGCPAQGAAVNQA